VGSNQSSKAQLPVAVQYYRHLTFTYQDTHLASSTTPTAIHVSIAKGLNFSRDPPRVQIKT